MPASLVDDTSSLPDAAAAVRHTAAAAATSAAGSVQETVARHAGSVHVPDLKSTIYMIAEDQPMWGVGLVLMILGTTSSAVGLLCLRRASAQPDVPWYRNYWFWMGLFLFAVTAALLDVIVFAITPLALIAPFAGMTIVVTFLLATVGCCGVREVPTKTTGIAVLLVVFGVTISCTFGPHYEGVMTPQSLQHTFDTHLWLLVACMSGLPMFALFGLLVSLPCECSVACKAMLRTWGGALALALIAAIYGACTQLQFKALATALMNWVTHKPLGYADLSMMALHWGAVASSALAQIGFLNFAISVAPVAYSVPAYQSGLLVLTLVLAGWVLEEYTQMSPLDNILFWSGAGVVALGMVLNAWGLARLAMAMAAGGGGGGNGGGGGGLDTPLTESQAGGGEPASRKKAPWEEEYLGGVDSLSVRRATASKFS